MRRFWEQLTRSQQRAVLLGLIGVGALMVIQFALVPYLESRRNIKRAIAAGQATLRELSVLGAEYGQLRRRTEEIRRVVERRPPGFSLLSHLERISGQAGVKGNIRSLSPLPSVPLAGYDETVVEMKLEKLTTKQLVDFLHLVEQPGEMIRIKRISLTKMKESPEYISALLQVFTYQQAAGGPR